MTRTIVFSSLSLRCKLKQKYANAKNRILVKLITKINKETSVHKGCYTVARRYIIFEKMFYERVQPVSKILFLTRENNIHIFKLPCNVLFIIRSEFGTSQQKLKKTPN